MFLGRRPFARSLVLAAMLTGSFGLVGCNDNPDQTGEAGIGAPGKLPDTPVPSDDEAYKLQQERDRQISKESQQ